MSLRGRPSRSASHLALSSKEKKRNVLRDVLSSLLHQCRAPYPTLEKGGNLPGRR